MPRLFIDIETFYPTLSVVDAGVYRSAEDAELLLFAYALGKGPVKIWNPAEGQSMPTDLAGYLNDPTVLVHAFNAMFERPTLLETLPRLGYHGLVPPVSRWRCDMVLALTKSLPAGLDKVGTVVGLPEDKKKLAAGKRLIRTFCGYRKPTKNKPWTRSDHTNEPDKWLEFVEYCRQDVEAQRQIFLRLGSYPVPDSEQRLWQIDQDINDKGLPIDTALLDGALVVAEAEHIRLFDTMQKLTGLNNPNSIQQLTGWLEDEHVYPKDLTKLSVSRLLERDDLTLAVREVLRCRQQIAKASIKKYKALRNAASSDDTLKGAFQFYGANRTGRWTGKKFQPHNLPRGFKDEADINMAGDLIRAGDPGRLLPLFVGDTMDVLSQCLRSVVRAPAGKKLVVADLNAIENRVLGWVAECDAILRVFRQGLCPYRDFGTRFFNVPYEQITAEMRTLSKPPVLGCGYMLGGGEELTDDTGETFKTGLWAYADAMGVQFTKEQSHRGVQLFRDSYPEVVSFWDRVDTAFRKAIQTKQPTTVGPVRFRADRSFVCIDLPVGRSLYYYKPTMEMRTPPWERDKKVPKKRLTICYWGQNQDTKKWSKITTHPGKITENIVQAIARDVLAEGVSRAVEADVDVRGHVHDEIIALADDRETGSVKQLCDLMATPIDWAPGLPLGAEGFEGKVYRKD